MSDRLLQKWFLINLIRSVTSYVTSLGKCNACFCLPRDTSVFLFFFFSFTPRSMILRLFECHDMEKCSRVRDSTLYIIALSAKESRSIDRTSDEYQMNVPDTNENSRDKKKKKYGIVTDERTFVKPDVFVINECFRLILPARYHYKCKKKNLIPSLMRM